MSSSPWKLPSRTQTDEVIGIDLGLAHPAVTSANQFLGRKPGRRPKAVTFGSNGGCRSCGSKSAKRHLRHLRGKQARFRRDCDHVLSKQLGRTATLVARWSSKISPTFASAACEAYTQTKRRMHSWSFAQLTSFLTYKAEERGLTVVGLTPATPRNLSAADRPPGTIAVLKVGLCVGRVGSNFTLTSTRRGILRPSTVPVGVDLRLVRRRQPAYRLRSGRSCVSTPHRR